MVGYKSDNKWSTIFKSLIPVITGHRSEKIAYNNKSKNKGRKIEALKPTSMRPLNGTTRMNEK